MSPPSVSEEMIRAALVEKAAAVGFLSIEDIDEVLAHLPAGSEAVKPRPDSFHQLLDGLQAMSEDELILFRYGNHDEIAKLLEWLAPAPPSTPPATNVQEGLEAAIRWVEKRHADYVEECGSYDPETNVTEFPDGGEHEGELLETIEGLQSLRSKQAPTVAVPDESEEAALQFAENAMKGHGQYHVLEQAILRLTACLRARAEQREAPSAVVGEGWRDISSAPKQHGHMILSTNRYGAVDLICWNNSTDAWDDGHYSEDADLPPLNPTLWQPAPVLPAAAAPTSDGR